MMRVGLTGGIGSGKTLVSGMFVALGIPVYNADTEAKKLLYSSGKIREAIVALLGKEAYKNAEPDRGFIAEKVFGNEILLGELNKIVHPELRHNFENWVAKGHNAPYVVQEAAILFESGGYKEFDRMILVCAPKELRIGRIMERDGCSREAAEARMAHQWTDEEKLPLADFVIENLERDTTREAVTRIHHKLIELASLEQF
jgi:dephospho-CoA kinase